eukprot:PhM_4_TR14665/c0_g1_i1/m.35530
MHVLSPADGAWRHIGTVRITLIGIAIFVCGLAQAFLPWCALYVHVVLAVCLGSLLVVERIATNVLFSDDGDAAMKAVSEPIREGAEGFLRTQYGAIAKMTVPTSIILFLIYFFNPPQRVLGSSASKQDGSADRPPSAADVDFVANLLVPVMTVVSFYLGAALSAVSGYVGMWLSVRANVRTAANASKLNYSGALYMALRSGAVCGALVVGLCIYGLVTLFVVFHIILGAEDYVASRVPHYLVGYGFGASLVALFAQLGGGIYTKAADVGGDMVGKIECSIPEDDPRNPAVIADLVGDNVGDCAGRGADLFESIAGEIIGTIILGAALAQEANLSNPTGFMFYPLLVHAFDLVISTTAVMFVRVNKSQANNNNGNNGHSLESGNNPDSNDLLSDVEDPMATLERGYMFAVLQAAVVLAVLSRWLLYSESHPMLWLYFYCCSLVGLTTSYLYVHFTKYYTDYRYNPVKRIAAASKTGHGTNVIAGFAVGLESTALPTITCGVALVSSYCIGRSSGLSDGNGTLCGGLFGTACATMGMLSTAVYVLAMDTFGPITDNAGGIAEMSQQTADVRHITDRLDAVGNVTKATTKGYSIGAAALASFLLLRAFLDVATEYAGAPIPSINLATPEVFVAALMGGMLVFLFSGLAISAVGRTAQEVVDEVRRQFAERPGIMDGTERPQYTRCVSIVTAAALREMIRPGLLAVFTPVIVGVVFRALGYLTDNPLLGVEAVGGMLMFTTASGILMALFLNNAGGAFDNAKKLIELGAHGGKGSYSHQCAVTGDTLGDPLKDTAGPSVHVLIKLVATIALVTCPMFIP